MILLHARVFRHGQARGQIPGALVPSASFAAGYLACWLGIQCARDDAAVRARATRPLGRHDDVVDEPLADRGAPYRCRALPADAAESGMPCALPQPGCVSRAPLASRAARRVPPWPPARRLLPWVLLGADAAAVCGRHHEPRVDRGPRHPRAAREARALRRAASPLSPPPCSPVQASGSRSRAEKRQRPSRTAGPCLQVCAIA